MTRIKQCVPFSPPHNCSFKLEIAFCVRGVVSPLLANVYLHYVFDLWIEAWRQKVATGDVIVVRYADDRAPRARKEERLNSAQLLNR